MPSRRHLLALAGASLASPALAAWPERPIRVVVPYAAGGNVDTVARLMQPRLAERLGQPVVVENRTGAGGSIGAELVARARADGYSLLAGSNGPLTVNPVVQARLPYDPMRDFAPIGMAMQVPLALMVQTSLRIAGIAELVAAARARPNEIGVGTAGVASSTHMALALFGAATGAALLHVPYRGGGAALPDFLAGNVPAVFIELSTALPVHVDGKGRIIGIAAAHRLPALPDIPTMIEQGVADFVAASYVGLLATAGTPEDAMRPLTAALATEVANPEFARRIGEMGGEAATPELASPRGFADFLRAELTRTRRAAEIAGIRPE
ncbi:Bug family tripartite tricarboxylate transporter substrate binding protein [Plastoroseomonas hellenica]|uniref:Bug family tripartite tricarboxylate transporter substrate binding protein n=1 Tax=Plastoroseomonas hellenica TaxID=2687306 RepID=UPI001BA9DB92|nr:tripartite tricarboxylate transporter substrate binding protein [Plastoroseomonas hellenica]MBR0646481.1 tripartite tricarboxylate transporter substrate binding protein [Plastoroseomonas hellenica]